MVKVYFTFVSSTITERTGLVNNSQIRHGESTDNLVRLLLPSTLILTSVGICSIPFGQVGEMRHSHNMVSRGYSQRYPNLIQTNVLKE